MIILMLKS